MAFMDRKPGQVRWPTIRRALFASMLSAAVVMMVTTSAGPAAAQSAEPREDQLGPTFMLSLGGKLYDDSWAILDIPPPSERNPAFPDKTVAVRDSWRCVSCHGWDYAGDGGERGRSVPGLRAPSLQHLKDADPRDVMEKILDSAHPFPSDSLSDLALLVLAAFIGEGQYDRERFLDSDGASTGNPTAGQATFEGACINCHELDGRAYLRGEPGDRSSLGWVARNRPEQALHKILNGVPMAEMLSLRFLSDEQIADLLAYVQAIDPSER